MSIFSKLFRHNKNVIELSEEELSEPISETEPQTEEQPVYQETIRLDGAVYFRADTADDARMMARYALRSTAGSFSETEDSFDIRFNEHISAKALIKQFFGDAEMGDKLEETERQALSGFNAVLSLTISGYDTELFRSEADKTVRDMNEELFGLAVLDGKSLGLVKDREPEVEGPKADAEEQPVLPDNSRGRSVTLLWAHGIKETVSAQEDILGEGNYPRNDTDVVKRIAGLLYTAMTALSAPVPGQTLPVGRYSKLLSKLSDKYAVRESLSAKEAEYVKQPSAAGKAAMSLKTEAAALLLWYLGLWELPWADTSSDAAELTGMLSPAGVEETLSKTRPRGRGEIEDMYD
ncbi:MAG: DUF4272 domain-containing protein, partial [Clostridia bacterium]|nr:DUF4272 domain-containing protein [Clostridia bacterium]